jgi:hypothetical protein
LKKLADHVEQRLEKWETDFVVHFKGDTLNAEVQTERLQRWLVSAARARLGKEATLAKIGEQIEKDQSTLRMLLPPRRVLTAFAVPDQHVWTRKLEVPVRHLSILTLDIEIKVGMRVHPVVGSRNSREPPRTMGGGTEQRRGRARVRCARFI